MSLDNSRNRSHEETLSALMDNEADELELRRLLKELPEEPGLADTWKRFHVARSVLHKEEMRTVSSSATNRIFAAIAAEPAYEAGHSDSARSTAKPRVQSLWLETVGRVAIAASVAFVVFAGLQSTMFAPQSDLSVAGADADTAVAPAVQVAVDDQRAVNDLAANDLAVNEETSGFDAEAQRRLNDYIRGVSIQYGAESAATPEFNILQDSQLIRQVNQIEVQPGN